MSKLLFANWKMNPTSEKEAVRLAGAGDAKHVVILVPFLFLSAVKKTLKRARFGVQNVSWEQEGPLTGEISPAMAKKMGAVYSVIGHSERREFFCESDAVIAAKVQAALGAGLIPILCVGEPLSVRRGGRAAAKAYVEQQLSADLSKIQKLKNKKIIIAYEPVWAISTSGGGRETPKDAAEMIGFIRSLLTTHYHLHPIRVLYGGSVNAKNLGRVLAMKEIDGALVGGASLDPAGFRKMVKIAETYQ